MSDLPELMTVAEIAQTLKLNQQTVRNWIDAGKIPHLRLGERRVRVYRSDFDAFIEASGPPQEPQPSIWNSGATQRPEA